MTIESGAANRDYVGEAELFAVRHRGKKQSLWYQRFDTAAEAIRFAIEEMPSGTSGVVLQTEFARLDMPELAALYAAEGFPLPRRATKPVAA